MNTEDELIKTMLSALLAAQAELSIWEKLSRDQSTIEALETVTEAINAAQNA